MPCFVTGIVSTNDISELETILGGVPNVDRSKLSVITKAEQTDEHDASFLNFIHAGGPEIESRGMGSIGGDTIMTGGGGTNVPGINRDPQAMGLLGSPRVVSAIGTLPIPDDEAENYNDALHDGRTVIAYECTDAEAAAIEGAMREAGVRRVKTYRS